jgi:hypothetical protein
MGLQKIEAGKGTDCVNYRLYTILFMKNPFPNIPTIDRVLFDVD